MLLPLLCWKLTQIRNWEGKYIKCSRFIFKINVYFEYYIWKFQYVTWAPCCKLIGYLSTTYLKYKISMPNENAIGKKLHNFRKPVFSLNVSGMADTVSNMHSCWSWYENKGLRKCVLLGWFLMGMYRSFIKQFITKYRSNYIRIWRSNI